ncbi:hypothetical protein EDB92DRAFT_1850975 [Lactarius akahatsu]|uniref:Tail specific protease domain-containing protein n=1 Tax=Lactarius akahatsu TaxID=416441 RepID=A0AAD4LIS1_9AGAM|nr:hypothetical protein EDB92DRAFT_1850975 [Lactarius akahatsu]
MLSNPFIRARLLLAVLSAASTALSAHPCVKIAGIPYVDPADAIACQKSFLFNETLRQNVLSVVSRVFDFYTFEDFYVNSPPPFEESTKDIRAEIARINATQYATDYDFNRDLWDFTTQLNDGHTRWYPSCYNTYQNILPAPVVLLDDGIFIAPDTVELLNGLGPDFAGFFAAKNFNWQRLAGARVLTIGGLPASVYIDEIARTVSGNYLSHNVRVNSVVSSYGITNTSFSQRFGDLAASSFLTQTSLTFSVIPANSTSSEVVEVPFAAAFVGKSFTNGPSYWANNCAANNNTNGRDKSLGPGSSSASLGQHSHARAARVDLVHHKTRIKLPDTLGSALTTADGSDGVIKSFILPGNQTGVMFVGSFEGDYFQFPVDVEAAVRQFTASGVTNLLIDVTNNGGGYVCLGTFLHQFLSGTGAGSSEYQSTSRANPLAQKIVEEKVELGTSNKGTNGYYASNNWLFLNGTRMPVAYNYNDPPLPWVINSRNGSTSQRFLDPCPTLNVPMPSAPPFDLEKILILGNGNCASTCAQFTTAMYERHQTKMVVFGGNQSQPIEYKGMAGMQVFEWADLDSEIKTVSLKNDPLAPPDLLVDGNMRLNWRTAYSFLDESSPVAYVSQQPQYRFPYTAQTYNNPVKLWLFTEKHFFG